MQGEERQFDPVCDLLPAEMRTWGAMVEEYLARLRAPQVTSAEDAPAVDAWGPFWPLALVAGLVLGWLVFNGIRGARPADWPGTRESQRGTSAAAIGATSAADEADWPPLVVPLEERRAVRGLLQFRGNPQHTFYGRGPVPTRPHIIWRYPERPMCAESRVGDEVRLWCGTGWTGQPVLWERPDGVLEAIVGTYDRRVHFIDAHSGRPTRPPFETGDIIKGSVTLDPDGDPLLYFGSRDNKLRIVALDRPVPTELWSLDADFVPGIWNNDWDGNPTVLGDMLLAGGENGYFFAFELHTDYGADGRVQVAPELLAAVRGWTPDLLRQVGDRNASIENSLAVFGSRAYVANSAGRILGLDLRRVRQGRAPVVFDFWVGDDVDASIVIDDDGMLYAAVELERFLPRSEEVGQLLKLDPSRPDDPLVWSLPVVATLNPDGKAGVWATPALSDGLLYVATDAGQLLVVDADDGTVLYVDQLAPHAWSSPVVVDDRLIVATCQGELRGYSLDEPWRPTPLWSVQLPSGACIESTPAVWDGVIVVGARDGYLYGFGDAPEVVAAPPGRR